MTLSRLFRPLVFAAAVATPALAQDDVPNLVGVWVGDVKRNADDDRRLGNHRAMHIREQNGTNFEGFFDYSSGRTEFVGILVTGNSSFLWMAPNSIGFNHGRILGPGKITACYVENHKAEVAGCADLEKVSDKP